jgi:type I restriction enzyme S subunit
MSTDGKKRPLPPGWRLAKLGDVCCRKDSGVWGSEPHGDARTWPVLRSNNIQDGQIVLDDVARRVIPEHAAAKTLLAEGDILITKSSGSAALIGKCALVGALPEACLFSNFTLRLRLKPVEALPEFVFRYLISPPAKVVLAEIQNTTTGLRNLDLDRYLNQLIPVAPVDEQRRIAGQLSQQMAQGDKMRSVAEAEVEAATALPSAFLRQVFESEEAKRWPTRRLGEISTRVGGGTPSRLHPNYWNGSIPWVSPKDMKVFDLTDSEEHITRAALSDSSAELIDPGAVLMVVRGMILGRDVPVAVTRVPLAINQDMKAIIPNSGILHPDYLAYALLAAKSQLLGLVTTSAHATRKLDTQLLVNLELSCPVDVSVQRQVAARIASHLAASERIQGAAKAQLQQIEALPGALLEDVFGGFEPPS